MRCLICSSGPERGNCVSRMLHNKASRCHSTSVVVTHRWAAFWFPSWVRVDISMHFLRCGSLWMLFNVQVSIALLCLKQLNRTVFRFGDEDRFEATTCVPIAECFFEVCTTEKSLLPPEQHTHSSAAETHAALSLQPLRS